MTPNLKKLLSALRKEINDVSVQDPNARAIEQSVTACLDDVMKIRSSGLVYVDRASLEDLYASLTKNEDLFPGRDELRAMLRRVLEIDDTQDR